MPESEHNEQPEAKRSKTQDTAEEQQAKAADFLCESDAGITEFVTPGWHGFDAIIKHRFSDFLVNEIDPQGAVVRLTSYTEADDPEPEPSAEEQAIKALDVPEDPKEAFAKAFEHLEPILGSSDTLVIKEHLEKQADDDDGDDDGELTLEQRSLLLDQELDKQQRKDVYRVTNNFLGAFVTVETVDGKLKFIRRAKADEKKTVQKPRGWGAQWRHCGDYCYFVMQKENTDSMDVLSQIARKLHVKPKSFGMAGTKDKRGITVQRCSAFRVDHKRLIGASRQLRSIRLGNFSYGAEELKLGRLAGNRFCIVLRFVQGADAESLAPVLAGLRDTGFINYYGMQRFGTQSISSHTVGLAVLKADWQLVVDLILRPRPGDSKDVARARALWAEGDFTGALRAMPPKAALAERSVLQTFASAGSKANAMAAFNAIPRNLRLMYVHAYQSFIWNTAASHRVRLFGVDSAVPGDLVIRSTGFCQSNADDQQPEPADDATHTEPLLVTADNAHEYSIYDVVLPLPGWAAKYPGHQVKAVYQETMQRDGLCPETMDKHPLKEYRLAGAYRHIVIRPRDFCFEWMRFDNDTLPLTQSDSDVIEGKSVPVSVEDGKHVALKLAFDLPSSAYATMLLRELIRKETTAGHQSTLSNTKLNDAILG